MQRDNAHQLQSHLALLHRAKERRRWSVASIPSSGYGTTTPASSNSQCSLNTDEHSNCSCAHHAHYSSHPHHGHCAHHSSHTHSQNSSSSLQLHGKFLHTGLPYTLVHHFSSTDSNPCVEEELRIPAQIHFRPRSRSLSSPVRTPQIEQRPEMIATAKNQLTLSTVGSIAGSSMSNVSPGTITFRRRSRSLSSPIRSPGVDNRFVQMNNIYKERFPNAIKQMQERLEKFVDENPELTPEIASNAVTRFVHHQVIEMAKDCLQKSKDDLITSHYFYEMSENLEKLLTECREKSSNAVIHVKKIIKKLLIIVSRPARLLECLEFNPDEFYRFLEVAEGQAKIIAGVKADIPQYIIEKLGLTRDPLSDLVQLDKNLKLDESEKSGQEEQFNQLKEDIKLPAEDDYETIKLISNGAYGAVYLVKHKESGQRFAMKKINKQNLVLRNQVEQAFAERDIMSFTDNPFVVSLFCSFETKKYLCMVMEYVEGGDCATLLKCMGPLPVDLARFYFAETVLAVEYLHSYGIVHRDLKPDNLLITGMGHIKLTDFGLSKIGLMNLATNLYEGFLDKETKQFNDKQVYGTPEYIAPEVILRQGYGKPVDWWSMGIILYEFLIGCVPFFGETPEELFAHVINDEIEWPDENEWPLPEEAKCLISQFLIQNPIERLGTSGATEVKEHCFFNAIDWDALLRQKAEFIPQLNDPDDTSYFDTRSDRYNHELQDSEDLEDTDESSLFSSFSSCSPRYHKVCSRTENQLVQELMKSSSTSSILEETNKSGPALKLGRNCLSQFECSSTSNLMRALSLNEPTTPGSTSATGSNNDLRINSDVQLKDSNTPITVTPDSSQTESEDYSPLMRRRRTLGAKDLPKFFIDVTQTQKEERSSSISQFSVKEEENEPEVGYRMRTPSIREIPPEDQSSLIDETDANDNKPEPEADNKDNLQLESPSRSVTKSASASGLSLLIPKLELLNRRCSGDMLTTDSKMKTIQSNQTTNVLSTKSAKNANSSVSEQNLSTSHQPKCHLRTTRPSLPGVYLISPSNSSTSSRDNSPNRHNRRRNSNQIRPTSGLATPPSAPTASTSAGHPLEHMSKTQLRHSQASLLAQLKPPIILRKSSRGFGFTLKAIRVFFGDSDVYTVQHLVLAVENNSPAFETGLKPGDLITHINGEAVQGLLHHQVLQLILSGGDRIQIQTMPLELSTIKTGGRKRNLQHSRFAKRSTRSQNNVHRRSGHIIGGVSAAALLNTSATNSSPSGVSVHSSSPIASTVLRRNDSEKRRKSSSLLRRLSSKRASAELNHLLGSQLVSSNLSADQCINPPMTPSRSYQSLTSPPPPSLATPPLPPPSSSSPSSSPSSSTSSTSSSNPTSSTIVDRNQSNTNSMSPLSNTGNRHQCTSGVTSVRSVTQSQFRSHPSFSDSSQSSSPTSPVPTATLINASANTIAQSGPTTSGSPVVNSVTSAATAAAVAAIYSRPNSLYGLKHKLVQTFRSPRRKSCGHIPLSPLARSGAPNNSGNSQMLSPTRSPSPLATNSQTNSNHSSAHNSNSIIQTSSRVHLVPACFNQPSTFHRSSPTSGRSTCSSSGEFEQPCSPFPEHLCKGRKYSSACCNCSPLALSSLPPSSGRSHFQCRSMIHQPDCVPNMDGRRSASPAAPVTPPSYSVRPPLPTAAVSEPRIHQFYSDFQSKSGLTSHQSHQPDQHVLKAGERPQPSTSTNGSGQHVPTIISTKSSCIHQSNQFSQSNQTNLTLSSSGSASNSNSGSSLATNTRSVASSVSDSVSDLNSSSGFVSDSVSISGSGSSLHKHNSNANDNTIDLTATSDVSSLSNQAVSIIEKDSESSCSSASDCSVRTTRLPVSTSSHSLGSLVDFGAKNKTCENPDKSNRSASTSKKSQMLQHQNSQPETTFAKVRKSLGSPINIRKSLFKQTEKRNKNSSRKDN